MWTIKKKIIYFIVAGIVVVFFYKTADSIYNYAISIICLVGAIFVLTIRKVIVGDVKSMRICGVNGSKLLGDEKKELEELFKNKEAIFNPNRDYNFNEKFLLIETGKKSIKIYYGIDDGGNESVKLNSKWFEINMTNEEVLKLKKVLDIIR